MESYEWDRRGDESDSAYFAFREYLALGAGRNPEMYRNFYSNGNNGNIKIWFDEFSWEERCEAYDEFIALRAVEDNDKILNSVAIKQKNLLESMRILADKKIKDLMNQNPEEVSNYDLIRLIELSIKLEQLLDSKPTEIVEKQGEPEIVVESITVDPDIIKAIGKKITEEDID